ncbi:TrkA family potassium uptake protein [Acinetobacter sp. B51(2017)]|uniref:potassium channel family protein n=1 Tax=Acinetobacter sp. B51(2017) TaxID=2060938 RepID=UPI000F087B97|nr:TrkA family potassium uptake protein [Acinetobacter sp. B51(2017)]
MAQFAVIGLGGFGAAVAEQLMQLNHDVLGIDNEKKLVDNLAESITHAVIADATDEHVLAELNIQNCDAAVVAIGEDIEASILCVLHLKNLGLKKIWVKANSKAHHMILTHLGVDKIIHPEEDMGIRVAQSLSYPMVSRYMALEDNHYLVRVEIKANMHGLRFYELMRHATDIRSILHKRGTSINYTIDPQLILQQGDMLVIAGELHDLRRLSQYFVDDL